MNRHGNIWMGLLKRALFAAPFLAFGWFVLFSAGGGRIRGLGLSMFGWGGIVAGAAIVLLPLAQAAMDWVGSTFSFGRRFSGRQPMYGAPRTMRARGEYEDAMAGFDRITEEYPDEPQAYIEMIEIAIVNLHDGPRANDIYCRGVAVLKNRESREKLATMYTAIRSRLRAPAETV